MRKVGDFYYHGNLKYVVDEINKDGTCNGHLVEVMKEAPVVETPSKGADAPVEDAKEEKPKTTTATPKRTYTKRKTTTTKKK